MMAGWSVGLPKHHLDFVEREVLLAKELHMLIVKTTFPALLVTRCNQLPMNIRHAVALVPEGLRFFLKLLTGINKHHPPTMSGGLWERSDEAAAALARIV